MRENWNLSRNVTSKIIITGNKNYQYIRMSHFVNLTFQCPFIAVIALDLWYFIWEMSLQIMLPFTGKELAPI